MKFSVQQIADLIEGSVEGDGKAIVSSLSKIEEGKEGTLSFLANPQYTPHIYHTKATSPRHWPPRCKRNIRFGRFFLSQRNRFSQFVWLI